MNPLSPSVLVSLLAGCAGKTGDTEESTPPDPPAPVEVTTWGGAGWNPILVTQDGDVLEPVLESIDGAPQPVLPLSAGGVTYAWIPDPPLEAGTWRVTGSVDTEAAEGPSVYAVEAYGTDPAFDPTGLVGTVWELRTSPWVALPENTGELLWSFAGNPQVVIDAVDGDQVDFRVFVHMYESEELCQVTASTGTLSPTGEFSWSLDRIDADTEPVDLHLYGLFLHWGWNAGATRASGAEGGGTLDTRALDPFLSADTSSDRTVCHVLEGLRASCRACPDDGVEACVDVRFHAGELFAAHTSIPDDPPRCGVDLEEAGAHLDCDFDLSGFSCTAALPLAGLASLWVRRRRRATLRG